MSIALMTSDDQGVGQDHVQHKALAKIILLNTIVLFVESITQQLFYCDYL